MSCRRWLDSETSVVVWYRPRADENDLSDDRWTVVFYGKYYTHYAEMTGEKLHLCLCVSLDGMRYYWQEYNISKVGNSDCLGVRTPWSKVPNGVMSTIMLEYRNIPGYNAKGLTPELYKRNGKNFYG